MRTRTYLSAWLSCALLVCGAGVHGATAAPVAAKPTAATPAGPTLSSWLPGQLGKVIVLVDAQITSKKDEIAEANRVADDYNYMRHWAGDPEFEQKVEELKTLQAECPEGAMMPEEQAHACNARIEAFNVYDKSIADQVKAKLDERDRITEQNERDIAELSARRASLARLMAATEQVSTCNEPKTRKPCLDKLFDNQTASGDIVTVALPDTFGGKKMTVQEVIDRYKASGDVTPSQLQRLTSSIKDINVPSPTAPVKAAAK
jgi:hypothetical protein